MDDMDINSYTKSELGKMISRQKNLIFDAQQKGDMLLAENLESDLELMRERYGSKSKSAHSAGKRPGTKRVKPANPAFCEELRELEESGDIFRAKTLSKQLAVQI